MRVKWLILFLLAWLLTCLPALAEETSPALPDDPAALAAHSLLPVLDLRTDNGAYPDDEGDLPATLTRYTQRGGRVRAESARILIRVRGNTSKIFPKQSFRLQAVDRRGSKTDIALAEGLRTDDDWILNPMYTDTSKIREPLAYGLWADMNRSGQAAASSRIAYAEVFLNGEYWGLYGVQERVDRKQTNLNKRFDVLYKVTRNVRPTVEQLLSCEDPAVCEGIELEFAGSRVTEPWGPAAGYMALLEGSEPPQKTLLSMQNVIDYGLFAMVAQAHDCHFKNQYISCVYTAKGYVCYKLPWDLNNTFGDIFQLNQEDINYTNFAVADLVMDSMFERLIGMNDPAFNAAIQARWAELRASLLTRDALMARAHALYDPLAEALNRDSLRWPESGMGNGNALNIRDLDSYFGEVLPLIDAWVEQLPTKGE